jgi:dephospho-CoA kinase
MLKVGLTGGVACGKSTVGTMFAQRGVALIDADRIAHDLMRPGQPVYEEVVRQFGKGMLAADGSIDRARLAQAAFEGGRVEELNRIVHPAVIRKQEAWMREAGEREPKAIVMVEAALLLEAGAGERFDKIVVVTCPLELKIARFAARHRMAEPAAREDVTRRMRAQWPDEKKAAAADYVIENTGSMGELERKVEEVYRGLKKVAESENK